MQTTLHLLTGAETDVALPVMAAQAAAGETVTVALLPGAPTPALPPGIAAYRVPDDLSYDRLLELVFAADRVVAW